MRTTVARIIVVVLALTAVGAPAAVAQEGWVPPRTDMRTPDARDAAQGRGTFNAPEVVVVGGGGTRSAPTVADDSGIDWGDAGIGAVVIACVLVVAAGGVLLANRRSAGAAA